MYTAHLFKAVGGEGFIESVVRVRRNVYLSVCNSYDYGRVVKISRRPAELNDVTDFKLVQGRVFGERTRALVINQKVIQVFDARPGRRSVVSGFVKPAESGGVIHNACACKNALRCKVCTVTA